MFDRIADLIKEFSHLFVFWYVLDPYLAGIVLRYGRAVRDLKPGFNWIAPFGVERALTANIAMHTVTIGPQSLMTKDAKQIVITSVATCNVEDVDAFILKVNGGFTALEDAATGAISDLIVRKTLAELADMNLAYELEKKVRQLAKRWGVGVDKLQIVDFSTMKSYRLLQHVNTVYPPTKEEF